jgi:hypothetical protein
MAKKKRKRYVAHVQKAKSAKAALRDLGIGFVASGDGLELINVAKNRIEVCGPSIDAAMSKIRYKWQIYIAAMGRSKLGQAYIKSEVVDVPCEYFKHELSSTVSSLHDELSKLVPTDQLSNLGWIALPVPREISEKELGALFDMLGCWENPAPWQDELLNGH